VGRGNSERKPQSISKTKYFINHTKSSVRQYSGFRQTIDWFQRDHWLVSDRPLIGFRETIDWFQTDHWLVSEIIDWFQSPLIGFRETIGWFQRDHWLVSDRPLISFREIIDWFQTDHWLVSDRPSKLWLNWIYLNFNLTFPKKYAKMMKTNVYFIVQLCRATDFYRSKHQTWN
jgi:hypothetical protein